MKTVSTGLHSLIAITWFLRCAPNLKPASQDKTPGQETGTLSQKDWGVFQSVIYALLWGR